jgi:CheY-like chemotaxis protein
MSEGVKILLSDDDVEDRFILTEAFESIGFGERIKFLENGELVLSYLDAITNEADLPSLIVLDLNMPRLSGIDIIRLLRKNSRYSHIPIIIFSTSGSVKDKQESLKAGARDYYVKPQDYGRYIDLARNFCLMSKAIA